MPIYRLLEKSGFEPAAVNAMTAAFEEACRELGLAERTDPLRDLVAKAVIACAAKGERDPIKLRDCALHAIKS